jgi:L-seryl-tRNA(Ser) seleniumtransferase
LELSGLPKIDRIVDAPELAKVRRSLGRRALTALARQAVSDARERVRSGGQMPLWEEVLAEIERRAEARLRTGLAPVINATGVLLHTNLGRAPLPRASLENIARVAGRYSTLELDAELGERTRRGIQIELGLAELVSAEDTLLTNNNAAAVLLVLSALAAGKEVLVSRGELVEIGGGFRIPEVLARSGARLVEVGTTNRTRVEDYARAIGENTACLLRVHPSNFKISGFAERPTLAELARLAHERGIPLVKDLGGGLLVDLSGVVPGPDLAREPTVEACLAGGADLVCFSLDKLFGGPQGGVVAGRSELVRRLREDPLARALRVDKLTLAALEPLLDAYRRGALTEIPLFAFLLAPVTELRQRAESWRVRLGPFAERARVIESEAAIGGGTLAESPIASAALRIEVDAPDRLAAAMRRAEPAILARIDEDFVVLDARTVFPDQDDALVASLRRALGLSLEASPKP